MQKNLYANNLQQFVMFPCESDWMVQDHQNFIRLEV